jgi:ribosomal protein L16/L10AE
VAKKGQLLFETRSSNIQRAQTALNAARVKLPIKSSVAKDNF